MTATETMVRMGELAVSGTPGDVLASLDIGQRNEAAVRELLDAERIPGVAS